MTVISVVGVAPSVGSLYPVIADLDADPQWFLIVDEPACLLFERTATATHVLPRDQIWVHVLREAEGVRQAYGSKAPAAQMSLAIAYFELHDFESARFWFRRYLTLVPGDGETTDVLELFWSPRLPGITPPPRGWKPMYRRGRGLPD